MVFKIEKKNFNPEKRIFDLEKMIFAGIDPGLSGGLAIVNKNKIIFRDKLKFNEKIINVHHCMALLELHEVTHVAVERAQPMPGKHQNRGGETGAAMFVYGREYGRLLGALDFSSFLWITVPPQSWQAHFKTLSSQDHRRAVPDAKERALLVARSLFPTESFILDRCRVPHDGCVDAALLAQWGADNRTLFGAI